MPHTGLYSAVVKHGQLVVPCVVLLGAMLFGVVLLGAMLLDSAPSSLLNIMTSSPIPPDWSLCGNAKATNQIRVDTCTTIEWNDVSWRAHCNANLQTDPEISKLEISNKAENSRNYFGTFPEIVSGRCLSVFFVFNLFEDLTKHRKCITQTRMYRTLFQKFTERGMNFSDILYIWKKIYFVILYSLAKIYFMIVSERVIQLQVHDWTKTRWKRSKWYPKQQPNDRL